MEEINLIIGKNIRNLREHRKLTQLEFSKELNYSDKSISKWENGDVVPSIDILIKIANFFNVTLNDLVDSKFSPQTKKVKKKKSLLTVHRLISMLASTGVWVVAILVFSVLHIFLKENYWQIFVWALTATFIISLIFTAIYEKYYNMFIMLSCLIWSAILSLYLQFLEYNFWVLFLIGIPLQMGVIIWAFVIKKNIEQKEKSSLSKKA